MLTEQKQSCALSFVWTGLVNTLYSINNSVFLLYCTIKGGFILTISASLHCAFVNTPFVACGFHFTTALSDSHSVLFPPPFPPSCITTALMLTDQVHPVHVNPRGDDAAFQQALENPRKATISNTSSKSLASSGHPREGFSIC